MAPPKGSRRSRVSFHSTPETNFSKFLQVFAIHGVKRGYLDLGGEDQIFPGDCIEVEPGKDRSGTAVPGEPWTAMVLEIKGDRKKGSLKDMFVRIKWFYTPNNLDNYPVTVGNLSSCIFGDKELVLSNHEQVIRGDTILGPVNVHLFDDDTPFPECVSIGPDEKWYRYLLLVGDGVTANRITPINAKRLPSAGCAIDGCHARYAPNHERQRYCPRSMCKNWYHEQCLSNIGFSDSPCPLILASMLAGVPGFDDNLLDIEYLKSLERSMYRVLDENSNNPIPMELLRNEEHWKRVQGLVWCAATPIVRGKEYGVVGTGYKVREARGLIEEMMKDQDDNLWPDDARLAEFKAWKQPNRAHTFKCNRCGGLI